LHRSQKIVFKLLLSAKEMSEHIQQNLFNSIKTTLPANLSLVDEVADTLNMSIDSAYRRLRNEKLLSIDEVATLCRKYNISIDALMLLKSNSVIFLNSNADTVDISFNQHLKNVLSQIQQLAYVPQSLMIYFAKDIPLFHYFQFNELATFKFYAWTNTILKSNDHIKKFSLKKLISAENKKLCKDIMDAYISFDSNEIWSLETINSTIRQIEYCKESMLFEDETDISLLYAQLNELITHIELQCNTGLKISKLNKQVDGTSKLKIYYNPIILGDNTILMEINGGLKVYLNHSILNYIYTSDELFCTNTKKSLQTIIQHSTLISESGSKERNKYFNVLRKEILRYNK
jgi:hypothetical protein